MNDKYIKLADVKRKLRYILKAYGTSNFVRDKIKSTLNDLPYSVKGDLETSLEAEDVQPVNKWISIKDRLPEIGRSVLIYYSPWEGDAIQVAKLDCDRLTFDICGEFNVGVWIVTHWMPLPEPPKEGDTNA